MATKLTWHAPRSCWKKKRNGRVFYLAKGKCNGQSDREGFKLAQREWHQILAALEAAEASPNARHAEVEADDDPLFSDPSQWQHAAHLANYSNLLAKVEAASPSPKGGDTSIGGLVAAFMQKRLSEYQAGQVTFDTYKEAKFKLAEFVEFSKAKGLNDITEVDAQALESFKQCQLMLVRLRKTDPERISEVTAKKRVDRLCQFLRWCYSIEVIDKLPRNVDTVGRITLPSPKPTWFTREECQLLYSKATDRTRCFMVLALNCGFRQKDIATLGKAHVDLERGLISRPRSKTGNPTSYKLWPLTVKLLRLHQAGRGTDLFFLNEGGRPLLAESVKDNGTPSATDSIKLAFNRLKKQAGMERDKRGFATFRKTAATLLNEHCQREPHIVDRFLGHTLAAMRKHYTPEFDGAYFEATDWLGQTLNLAGGAE